MVVCKFFLQGNCRFGENCRNEHPRNTGFGNQNRFGALAANSGNEARNPDDYTAPTVDDIRNDLTEGKNRPKWILSAYGPGKNPPASLLQSNEFSPEELRVRYYKLAGNGQQDTADQEAISLWNKAQQDIDNVKNNADEAKRYIDNARKTLPNRYTVLKSDGKPSPQTSDSQNTSSAFGGQSSNPFGKPATASFGQPAGSSPFSSNTTLGGFGSATNQGAGGFGSTTNQAAGGFGQSDAQSTFGQTGLGKPSISAGFSQPSFGSTGFGSSPQSNNPFAPASASSGFGSTQPAQPIPAFGQSAQPTSAFSSANSGFGQAQPMSSFGQPAPASAFGQPTNTAFGQPSEPASTFGQPSQPTSTFGQPSQTTSTFGQPSQSSGPSSFGTGMFNGSGSGNDAASAQPAASTDNPFGVKSTSQPFGSGATGTGIFGGSTSNTADNPFGVNAAAPLSKEADMDGMSATRPFSSGKPFEKAPTDAPGLNVGSPQPLPATVAGSSSTPGEKPNKVPLTYAQTLPKVPSQYDAQGKLISFRGQGVMYVKEPPTFVAGAEQPPTFFPCFERPDGKGLEKIWFPQGDRDPVVSALNKKKEDLQAPDEEYTEEVKEAYRYLHENGTFKDGIMPSVPPMREYVDCDF